MQTDIIFHIDVNSAFLSWTALQQLQEGQQTDLRKIPAIIGGDISTRHGVVLAKSISAKAYGIVTGEPVVNALRKCPKLTVVPPNHRLYTKRSQELMTYLSCICPDIEQVSIDECYMNYSPIAANYTSPIEAAAFIRDSVQEKFHYTVNIGISDKKVLAKMASDFQKPNRTHTLYSREIAQKLWPLPVSSLFMCGKSSVETLHKLGIRTIGELAATDPDILEAHLKSHGITLWQYANGIDASGVVSTPAKAKGISSSTTLSNDAESREDACRVLLSLCETIGERLRSSQQLTGQVCVEIKYNSFKTVSHQMPLEPPTDSTNLIYTQVCSLFDRLWNGSPIRLLGVRTSRLSDTGQPVQLSLFDYEKPVSEKQKRLDAALDNIRKRYGKDSIKRGSLLDSPHTED